MNKTLLFFFLFFGFHLGLLANTELKIQHWQQSHGLPTQEVISFSQDNDGYIILHCRNGAYRFDGYNSYPVRLQPSQSSGDSVRLQGEKLLFYGDTLTGDYRQLLKANGEYWVTGRAGFGYLDTTTRTVTWLNQPGELPDNDCDNPALAPDGKIWFAMPLMGVGFYDSNNKRLYSIQNINQYPSFLNAHEIFSVLLDRAITALFLDRNNCLWIATRKDGLYKISFEPQRYQFFRFEFEKEAGLAHRDISFPLPTQEGDVWISTWGGGINVWAKDELESAQPKFKSIPVLLNNNKPFPDMHIFPLMEDSRENIWIGTRSGGLYMINKSDRQKGRFRYKVFNVANGLLPCDEIGGFCEGANNEIWCGLYDGLVRIDEDLKTKTSFEELENPDLFRHTDVCMISYTKEGRLWIGARNNMLYFWDMNSNNVDSLRLANETEDGRVLNHVHVDGTDWFVSTKGVFYYDKIDKVLRPFMNNNRLPNLLGESLLADDDGMLWVGTSAGLARLNPVSNEVKTFNLSGGTMATNFTQGASKDKNGYMYFGSRYGLYRFHPRNMVYQPAAVPIVFSKVGISGETILLDSLKKSSIWHNNENSFFQLKHNQNTISFDFLTLNYEKEDETVYEILLEGNDAAWTETSDTRRTWSGLNPGFYTFKVKQKGQDKQVEISFEIFSPWWITWPAIILYVLMLAVLIIVFYRVTSLRAKEKEKRRQKEKYDQLRFRFFLNISHEIRTPLTLIKGAIDRLVDKETEAENKELHRIKYNTGRLIRMVNEVLDLKKIEQAEVEVNNTYFNLKEFLSSTVDAFRLREDKCKIYLDLPESPVWINSGRELLETVLYNLLSNAIKFSPENDKVEVSLASFENSCVISVRDHGVGISPEEQEKIFDRFYKNEKNGSYGAGIGLSLVKEFVGLLNGKIELESEVGKGTAFIVILPLDVPEVVTQNNHSADGSGRKTILVVDDHADIRSFISEVFEESFRCVEAENGKAALKILENLTPELIISDVMMPEMNGFELCREVKDNIETSHIPLILLTAKTDIDSELKSAECSADAFVAKPFHEKLLKAKVEQLIEQRKRLREKFSAIGASEDDVPMLNSIDTEFIRSLEKAINDRLDDSEFNVDDLAASVALSSSGLYRKIKALTDQSPVEFIRVFRLKKSALLLREANHSVTEIADMTGFGTQKYFSRCFKEQFGVSPLNFRKQGTFL